MLTERERRLVFIGQMMMVVPLIVMGLVYGLSLFGVWDTQSWPRAVAALCGVSFGSGMMLLVLVDPDGRG